MHSSSWPCSPTISPSKQDSCDARYRTSARPSTLRAAGACTWSARSFAQVFRRKPTGEKISGMNASRARPVRPAIQTEQAMRPFLAALILAASLSMPSASSAEAGFFTSVAKGAVSNAIRHTKCKLKRTC
jgi:hypothetical protein